MNEEIIAMFLGALITFLISLIVGESKYHQVKAKIGAIANAMTVLDTAMEDDKIEKEEARKIYEAFRDIVEDP